MGKGQDVRELMLRQVQEPELGLPGGCIGPAPSSSRSGLDQQQPLLLMDDDAGDLDGSWRREARLEK